MRAFISEQRQMSFFLHIPLKKELSLPLKIYQ